MNENDKQAFWRWLNEQHHAVTLETVWQAALEYARSGETVACAEYFALADAEGKHIKKNYFSGQLEIYEEASQVPCSHKDTSRIAVFVTKTNPPAAPAQPDVQDLYAALDVLPPSTKCEMTAAEFRNFKLGWRECEAAFPAALAKWEAGKS